MQDRRELTADDGPLALRDHVAHRAALARERLGTPEDYDVFRRMLEDREIVRYPTKIVFDADSLEPGEFAYARQDGARPADGFCIVVHPHFEDRAEALPLLIAYQLVRVNYGEIATYEEAELFGATLLGLDVETYYQAVCRLADELLEIPGGDCSA